LKEILEQQLITYMSEVGLLQHFFAARGYWIVCCSGLP